MDFTHTHTHTYTKPVLPCFYPPLLFQIQNTREVLVYTGGLSDFLLISYIDFKFIYIKLYILVEIIQTSAYHCDTTKVHQLEIKFRNQGIYLLQYLPFTHPSPILLLSAIPSREGKSFAHHGAGVCTSD